MNNFISKEVQFASDVIFYNHARSSTLGDKWYYHGAIVMKQPTYLHYSVLDKGVRIGINNAISLYDSKVTENLISEQINLTFKLMLPNANEDTLAKVIEIKHLGLRKNSVNVSKNIENDLPSMTFTESSIIKPVIINLGTEYKQTTEQNY